MRDIPIFATEYGVASLGLKEIPYTGVAYITIRDSGHLEDFLQECISFCKMAGAEKIYATGHNGLQQYASHVEVWQMSALRDTLPQTDAELSPVTEKTAEQWREIYNKKMRPIDNASVMTKTDMEALVQQGGGYFVHRGEDMLGIGIARGNTVESVISVRPGAGREVMLTLCGCLCSETIVLEVASTNFPALKLYEKLGFVRTKKISAWYDVLTRKNT
ncbi:MAG: GNAT family N-acetyltransferase [Oscillospiraceae bacterium]|nr:GNAT family N-acetyltransferase [Oscillospiraceae bacterium]